MFYITGDIHSEIARFTPALFPIINTLTANDYLFICGDFGFTSLSDQKKIDALNQLEHYPFTILFIDGNHEHFHDLYSFSKVKFHNGYAHQIRKNIYHLIRGEIYTILDTTFFVMGGGYSYDKDNRIEGFNYFKEELPSEEEYQYALNNLKKHNHTIDYIITHSAPTKAIWYFHQPHINELLLNNFLQYIDDITTYKHWYFGHLHQDKQIDDKHTALWFDIREITTNHNHT